MQPYSETKLNLGFIQFEFKLELKHKIVFKLKIDSYSKFGTQNPRRQKRMRRDLKY